MMGAIEVAMRRQLSSVHPIFQLMRPHLSPFIEITAITREKLSRQEGHLELLRRTYKTFKFVHLSSPSKMVKEREIDDGAILSHYPLREDGFRLWLAISEFFGKSVTSTTTFLGDYSQTHMTGDDVKGAISRFQDALKALSEVIKARNASGNLATVTYCLSISQWED
ncbi:hypothetical protein OS493_035473 [Desmophyllum pertusum]|uniref:Lipoxygenase domain-containing protein n=1 Tax=Desmophyllum pertusum TaxID=174260 RepID=A0A9W9ZA62_9CNID|nr:hypothetical protein OS493_035473 [Desmophyllum pertusum]